MSPEQFETTADEPSLEDKDIPRADKRKRGLKRRHTISSHVQKKLKAADGNECQDSDDLPSKRPHETDL